MMAYRAETDLSRFLGTLRIAALSGALGLCISCAPEAPAQGDINDDKSSQNASAEDRGRRSDKPSMRVTFRFSKDSPAWRLFLVKDVEKTKCPFTLRHNPYPDDFNPWSKPASNVKPRPVPEPKVTRVPAETKPSGALGCTRVDAGEDVPIIMTVQRTGAMQFGIAGEFCSRSPCIYSINPFSSPDWNEIYYYSPIKNAIKFPNSYFRREVIDGSAVTVIVYGNAVPSKAVCYVIAGERAGDALDEKEVNRSWIDCLKVAKGV